MSDKPSVSDEETLKALARIYLTLHVIDLRNDTVAEFSATKDVGNLVHRYHFAQAATTMRAIMKQVVCSEQQERMLAFTELSTLAKRLGSRNSVSEEFQSTHQGWCRGTFIVINRGSDGLAHNVIWATQVIEEQKQREAMLVRYSKTDELTGFFNRRAYEEDLTRLNNSGCLDVVAVSLDVDGLKQVNDSIGHAAGDELLRGVARCMRAGFGMLGSIYRTGGDEFVVLARSDRSAIESALERFAELQHSWRGDSVKGMTVSCGFAVKEENPHLSMEQLVTLADRRMYEQKRIHYCVVPPKNPES